MSTIQGLPPKMLGRFVGAVSLASVTRNASGLFTVDGVVSGDLHVSSSLKNFSYKVMNNQVDQSASDVFLEDNVAESGGYEITITEQRLANYIPLCEQIAFAGYSHFRVQRNFLPPGATVPFVFYAICALKEFDGGEIEKGPMEVTLTGNSCGISPQVQSTASALLY